MCFLGENRKMQNEFSFLEEIAPAPGNLIKGFQLIQSKNGYLSDESIAAAAEYFGIPAAEAEGVASFYAQFKRVKPGVRQISVCDGTACHIKGSPRVLEWISQELGISDGECTPDGLFSLTTVACLGCCSLAPVISIDGKVYGKLDRKRLSTIIREMR
jgi:NADH:ubiquinone oxidoreductase subunit E